IWNASAVRAPPRISARGVAPRARSCSSDSTMQAPPPSPRTNPSRVESNGREACSPSSLRLLRAPMLPRAAIAIGRTGASAPPVSTTSHSPSRTRRSASWKAITDVAQAATWVITGPVRWYSIERRQAPIEPDRAGTAKGLTKRGPFVSATWVPSMICSIPPPPVFITTPTRSRWSSLIAVKSIPDEATASLPAAIANWMKRLIRRAILASIATVGSKSRTSAAIFTSKFVASNDWIRRVPETPATRLRQYVGKSPPLGITQPIPVITARRAGSELGGTGYLWGGRSGAAIVGPGRWRSDRGRVGSVPVVVLEDDRPVVPAQADVVRKCVADPRSVGLGRDEEVAFGVGFAVVEGRGDRLLGHRHDRGECLERAGRTHHVAGQRLRGADRDLWRVVPEHVPDRLGFANIAHRRRRAVGVEQVDLVGRHTPSVECHLHRPGGAAAVGDRLDHVPVVGRRAVAHHLGVDARAARLGQLEALAEH